MTVEANGRRGVDGVRVDDGVYHGGEVSIYYDPMIAKLVTWGKTRDEAADKQIAALDAFQIEGLGHNIDFLSALMQHERFRSGEMTTGFIAEEYPDGFEGAPASEELLRNLAAISAFSGAAHADRARRVDNQLGDQLDPPSRTGKSRSATTSSCRACLEEGISVDGTEVDLSAEYTPGDRLIEASVGDEPLIVKIRKTITGFALNTRGAKSRSSRAAAKYRAACGAHDREGTARPFQNADLPNARVAGRAACG